MFAKINLDKDELQTLSEAAINHPNFAVRHRAASLFWIYYGYSEKSLPNNLIQYPGRLESWIADYEEFGIASLLGQFETVAAPAVAASA